MNKDEIRQLIIDTIREEVRISISHERDYGSEYYVVSLTVDGECISSESFHL